MEAKQLAEAIVKEVHTRFPGLFNTTLMCNGVLRILLVPKLDGGRDWNNGVGCAWMVDCNNASVGQMMKWAGKKTHAAYSNQAQLMLAAVSRMLCDAAFAEEFIHVCPEHGPGEEQL